MFKDRLDIRGLQVLEVVLRRLSLHFEVAEYFVGFRRPERLYFLWTRYSFEFDDFGDLFDGILPRKEGASGVELIDETT